MSTDIIWLLLTQTQRTRNDQNGWQVPACKFEGVWDENYLLHRWPWVFKDGTDQNRLKSGLLQVSARAVKDSRNRRTEICGPKLVTQGEPKLAWTRLELIRDAATRHQHLNQAISQHLEHTPLQAQRHRCLSSRFAPSVQLPANLVDMLQRWQFTLSWQASVLHLQFGGLPQHPGPKCSHHLLLLRLWASFSTTTQ